MFWRKQKTKSNINSFGKIFFKDLFISQFKHEASLAYESKFYVCQLFFLIISTYASNIF